MLARVLPGEHACDVLGLRHAAAAQRVRRCERRLQQAAHAQYELTQAQLAVNAPLRAANPCAETPREAP
ncbi:MAG: hypothetical protein JWN73_4381 [Betaproteobacteria bacterium]|nr:hypothetical protein [Betaproteobacteria bacterium]